MNIPSKKASCSLFLLLFLLLYFAVEGRHDQDDSDSVCSRVQRCSHGGPAVRFPFRLKDHHPPDCGHPDPAFHLSCNQNHHTVINLPTSAQFFVKNINYTSQKIQLYNPYDEGCFQRLVLSNPYLNVSASPFHFSQLDDTNDSSGFHSYVIFNCSLTFDQQEYYKHYGYNYNFPSCSSILGYQVKFVSPDDYSPELTGCSSIGVTPIIPWWWINPLPSETRFDLRWTAAPNCVSCERQNRGCRFKKKWSTDNITTAEHRTRTTVDTECSDLLRSGGERTKQLMIGVIPGTFLLIGAAVGLYFILRSYEKKRKHDAKIKQFLEDYKSLRATRYSYSDIKIITNQFKQQLGQGAFEDVYKGNLANNILVAVKILTNESMRDGQEFINEVASMGSIHHVNVARLVGFCADGSHRALVYEFLPNESLEKFIFSKNDGKRVVLGLEKLQDIALGIAKGMEYLHHGCDQQILHFDIKPHNILLDHNFVPKISDFGLAKLCSKEKSVVTVTAARGTMGYIAPEVATKNFGKPSYKSDVYSFGMLLLEMVGGRKNIDVNIENASQVYFPEWVYKRMDQGEELKIEMEEEGLNKIVKKLTIVALKCIQWHPMDRPSMKEVVQMLEGDGDNLTAPPNPFVSGDGFKKSATKPTRLHNLELEIIAEAE